MKGRILGGLLFLFFLLFLIGPRDSLKTVHRWITRPAVFLLRTNSFFLNDLLQFSRTSRLVEENRFLKRKLAVLSKEKARLEEELRKARREETLLAFQSAHPETKGVFCHIIGRSPSHWSRTLLLDRGAEAGLEPDMAVVGTKGLVGRVIEVESSWGKVLLITDSDSRVGVLLERSREAGLLVGRAGGFLTLEYLSPDADVREGDKVITAGFGTLFPKGIPVGEVVGFGKREDTLLRYAVVRPAETLSQLEEVLCLKR